MTTPAPQRDERSEEAQFAPLAWLYFSGSNYPTRGIGSSAGWAEFQSQS